MGADSRGADEWVADDGSFNEAAYNQRNEGATSELQ